MPRSIKGRILLIARPADLRNSLQFALEAEGYVVDWRTELDGHDTAAAEQDCVVLDHHSAADDWAKAELFCIQQGPVVVLSNQPGHPLEKVAFRTVLKPMLGPAVVAAVEAAVAAPRHATLSNTPSHQL